jgi:two-component system nitrogen regulation response regulator NtrX
MSLKTQAKVLRVLQEQVTEPVGSTTRVQVDVRVLAATNKDLLAEIRGGRFREDLYFRLNVIPIFVPSLRDRAEDIPLLVEHFIADLALEYGKRAKTVTPAAMARLKMYRWPGNVRELRNVIERVVIMAPEDEITDRDLAFLSSDVLGDKGDSADAPAVPLYTARDQFERDYILRELAHQQGNISRTADVLGVERSNLYRKMRAFGIVPRKLDAVEDSEEAV